jgi:Sigma-70 region 2
VTSDEALMDEIRQGRRAAFETLFDRYREPIWAFFRRRTPDEGRAEELAQDTFVAVLEGAARPGTSGAERSGRTCSASLTTCCWPTGGRRCIEQPIGWTSSRPPATSPIPIRASGSATPSAEKTNTARRVTYATITLNIAEERKAGLDASPLSLATRIRIAAADGLESALESVAWTVLFLLRAGPTLILWSVVVAVVWLVLRRRVAIRDSGLGIRDPR